MSIIVFITVGHVHAQTDMTGPGNGTASASSEGAGFEAAKAFDNGGATLWMANSGNIPPSLAWLQWAFAGLTSINGYSLQAPGAPQLGVGDVATENWSLMGSNDGANWINLDTQNGIAFSPGQKSYFPLAGPVTHQYYRFTNISLVIDLGGMGGVAAEPFVAEVELLWNDNNPPTITNILDQTTPEDTPTPPIPFTVTDGGDGGTLAVFASSDNPGLIPDDNIEIKNIGNEYTVVFTPADNKYGTANIDISALDIFNYTHEFLSVHVTPVNDPPTVMVPGTEVNYIEDDPSADLPDITVDDVDELGHTVATPMGSVFMPSGEQVTTVLTLDNTATGTLTASSGNGETYDGTTGVWTITGTLDIVNAALAAVSFIPAANNDIDSNINVHVEDLAGTGPADVNILLDVTPVNDPPTATNMNQTHELLEDGSVDLDDIVVDDVDTGETITVTLTLADPTYGTLTASTGNGETYNTDTGVWMVTGNPDQVNSALAGISFIDAPNNDISTSVTTHVEDVAGTGPDDGTVVLNIIPVNDQPTITNILDQTTPEDTPTEPIPFTIGDIETPPNDLILTGTSSNTELVSNENIVFGTPSPGGSAMRILAEDNRTVTITPLDGQSGTTEITIMVSDGVADSSVTFILTVRAKPHYTLTTQVEDGIGGTVTVTPQAAVYDSCTWVTLTAFSGEGFVFDHWSGDLTGSNNPDSLHMNGDKTVTAHFTQTDTTEPELVNQFPPPGALGVPVNANVQFTVQDAGTGVDTTTLNVTVNGTLIVSAGADQTGGQVTITAHSPRYTVVYDPAENFEGGSTVTVNVQCDDFVIPANSMDASFDFTTSDSATVIPLASGNVGQAGGTVTHEATGLQVTIPPGALSDSVEITIGLIENHPALPDSIEGIGLALHFGPDGIQFEDSVTIRIPYNQALLDSAGVTDPMDLKVYYYLSTTGAWIELEVFAADAGFFYVKVTQFCYLTSGKPMGGSGVKDHRFPAGLPTRFELHQNHPNPFNPVTTISFALPERIHVNLSIYNMIGRLVQVLLDETRDTGVYAVEWDASRTGTGIYFYVIRAGSFTQVRKCILMK